jgi:hypothetical protein
MHLVGLGMEREVLPRKPYPKDVSDDEWTFVAPYLRFVWSPLPRTIHNTL